MEKLYNAHYLDNVDGKSEKDFLKIKETLHEMEEINKNYKNRLRNMLRNHDPLFGQ